jgi:tetratricopeptide (TPR) repeat protein
MPLKMTPKKQVTEDPRHTQAVQNYESGLRALQEHKFEKAKGHLQKVLSGPNKSLVDRAQVHILTCDKHLETPALQFKTTEEHYDYAVSLINAGDYVTAHEQLDKLLKQNPKAEYVLYGLAALHCLTGHVEESLKTLDEAIQIRPSLRFQARNDTDFQNLAEDPRFTELLYPDPGAGESEPQEEEASAY